MPAPSTADEFVDLVRKSAVLDESRLSEYVQKLKSDPAAPRDPSGVAGLFVRDGLLTYFQAEQFLQGKWKRFSIGKYKVLEKLGSGGMGQVFLCEHKLMRRRVAVKVLPINKANDPSSLERFYREARAVAALDHPNIVRAYDIDQDDNLHFLVMEYVDGSSLQDMIKKAGPMDPTRACHYMYWSAIGLQHAHANGLYHRDIKPGNILVDRTGVVKILDLGLARFFNDDQDLLTKKYDESVLGTADYLAPEQAVDSHTVDGRADIYSLGATFFFLLTGNPPFAEGTVAQKLLWHQTRNPKPIREVRPAVTPEMARVLEKMMAKKPEDRYATPAQLAEALLPFTQTPIPPPPSEEMPQLSVAAQGTLSGQVPVLVTQKTMGGAPKTPPPTHGPRTPAMPTASPPGAGVAVADADTHRNKPVPVVEPLPDSLPVAQLWASISADTAKDARADTDRSRKDGKSNRRAPPKLPKPKSAIRPPPARPRAHARAQKRAPVLLLVLLAALVMLLGVAAVYWFLIRTPDPPPGPQGPRTLGLTKNPTGPLQFATLQKAMGEFREGDTVVILDDVWDEVVNISRAKGMVLTARAGKRVIWKPPSGGQRPTAILTLYQSEAAQISGITFQCENRADYAIRLAGNCPGLVLDHLEVSDASIAALSVYDCSGDQARPVVVRRARMTDAGLDPKDARTNRRMGVQFATLPQDGARAGAVGSASVEVEFLDCTIDGAFPGGGFVFEGGATAVEIKNARVKAGYGLVFRKPRPEVVWKVDVTGCEFDSSGAGVRIDDAALMKRPDDANKIRLVRNTFAGTRVSEVTGAAPADQKFLVAEGNLSKPGMQPNIGQPLVPTTEQK
jgi:serine/threonine protein kinase